MRISCAVLALAGGVVMPQAQAASQAWTNAPVDGNWTNVLNWVGKAVPGAVSPANSSLSSDIVTFTNALPLSGIGGIANPITNDAGRQIAGFVFDTANCGAYAFGHDVSDNFLDLKQGFNIQVGATVANPINFNEGVRIRLPSQTNGRYDITNNATVTTATLYFAGITNNSASTRPLSLYLNGSNTGTNTVSRIDSQFSTSGSIHLFKEGIGRWILSGPNDIPQKTSGGDSIPANVLVDQGTLEVQDAGSLGALTMANIVVTNTGVLQIDNVTLNNTGVTLRNGGTVRMNGAGTINGLTMGNFSGNVATIATTSATDILTIGNAANTMIGSGADGILHLTGPGTVVLPYSANYVGKWSLDSGTNQISDPQALGLGGNYTINAGSVFDASLFGATTYSWSTKAISANGTGTTVGSTASTIVADPSGTVDLLSRSINLTYSPTATNGDTAHPALYMAQGTLACNGNAITVNNTGAPLNVGTYRLIHQASGTINASGTFATYIAGNGLVSGLVAEAVASGADINLIVYPYVPQNMTWIGNDPLLPAQWDRQVSTNWLVGTTPSTFNIYDTATFNYLGSTNPTVNIAATVEPSSVTVDTTSNSYTFTGSGQIAGGASLTKNGVNTLFINQVNTYSSGTVVNNGTVSIGIDNAIPSTGTGDVAINSPGVLDLNGFSDIINGLNGNGIVNISSGGTSTLTVGANDNNASFAGVIQNTSGTLGLLKTGLGTQTLTASNSYAGPTIIDTGTLRASNTFAIGGGVSVVTITNGTLDVATNVIVAGLNGSAGAVVNASTSGTNQLTIAGTSTFGGVISGKLGVTVSSGTFRVNAANAYTNATLVAGGATLAFGNTGQVGSGGVIASNGATLNMPTVNSPSPAVQAAVKTVDGATVTFTSASTASTWSGQFSGTALATNLYSGGNMSISGALSFTNFLGTAIMSNGTVRWFNASSGGDNTFFWFTNGGGCFARDAVDVIHLGALGGNGVITGPSVSFPATYLIGGKGVDCEYSGGISGSNNIVKVGAARLTLDGTVITTNTDNATYTNYIYASTISYLNNTTISNGVLALSTPDDLTSSINIIVAATNAVLDTYNMGYVTNFLDVNSNPDSALITNGWLTVVATTPNGTPQTLGGIGMVKGNGVINNGTINPGLNGAGGTLSISNSLLVNAGATNYFDLSDDPTGLVTPSDMLKVQTGVGLSGSSVIGIGALNGVIKTGKYPLIKYGANLTNETGIVPPGSIPNLTLGGPIPATTRATMVITNGVGEIDLGVVSLNTTNLVWAGDGVSNWWDVVNSYNWTNSLGAALQFYQLDNVTFNDSSTNQSVILLGTVVPTTLVINSSSNYIFGGTGNIGGDTLLYKTGTGTLILTNGVNTYNGGTIISNGVLNVGSDSGNNQNDLALGPGPVSVNGATAELRFGGNAGNAVNHFITNAITLSNGGILKAQDGVQHFTNTIVTVGVNGGVFQTVFGSKNLVFDGQVVGTGSLTVSVPAGFTGGAVVFNNTNNTLSGAVAIATNGILALVNGAGLSNVPTIDIQAGGTLDVSGRTNTTSSITLLSGQTLKGNGTVRGLLLTAASGSTVSPGVTTAIGTLTVTNTGSTNVFSTVTLAGTTVMELNRTNAQNSDRLVSGTNNFGGTLTVNNIGPALAAGDTFTLFTSITNKGAFAATNLPALGSGLVWSNSLAINGKLTVVTSVIVPTVPPGITNFSLVGGNIVISGTNGQSGGTYYLLSTTNVATPRNQWKTVATNVLGGANFTFIGTNAITTGSAQQFYMLSSTNYNP